MNWLTRVPSALWFFARGLLTSIVGNLSLVILSAALALSLWLFVTDAENPTERSTFNSAIEISFVNIPDGLAVSNASASTVRIEIEAPENDLADLRASDFSAEANLGGLSPGETSVAVAVRSANRDVRIVSTTPEQVDVTLEPVRTKEVPVRVEVVGAALQGFAPGAAEVEPGVAVVTGAQSLVDRVDSAVARAEVFGLSVDFSDDRVSLSPRDSGGGDIGRVTVSPASVSVRVPIEQRQYTLEFVVNPEITGQPAAGHNVASISVIPSIVTLTGPLNLLQSVGALDGVSTDPISIGDAQTSISREVSLDLPSGIDAIGGEQVLVTITIEPARGEASFLVVPQARNVGEGLAVTIPEPVLITLSGEVPTLRALTPESIVAILDAQGLGAGLHVVPVQVTPPAGTTLARAEPGEAGIALAARP
jgi:YbbR domain-containing protein